MQCLRLLPTDELYLLDIDCLAPKYLCVFRIAFKHLKLTKRYLDNVRERLELNTAGGLLGFLVAIMLLTILASLTEFKVLEYEIRVFIYLHTGCRIKDMLTK